MKLISRWMVMAVGLAAFVNVLAAELVGVELMRTPHGGIQPQAAVGADGSVHLLYYKGGAMGGDLFYVRQEVGRSGFSKPMRVNAREGSAVAVGTIRGGQLAVGQGARVHVVWNGGAGAGLSRKGGAPLLYSRLNASGTAFEPERDLITAAAGLDGGSSVAADNRGRVWVVWHAQAPDGGEGEAGRGVFVARSADEGKTFAAEKQVNPKETGVCACCGLRAYVDESGWVYILYRAAREQVNRDAVWLVSKDGGMRFEVAYRHPWRLETCPMSSAALGGFDGGVLAAWETAGQVYYSSLRRRATTISEPVAAPGDGKRKHPAVAANAKGERLLVWTEGTGWEKGGAVAWQGYDSAGRPTAVQGRRPGVPVWSLATVFTRPDGKFVVVY